MKYVILFIITIIIVVGFAQAAPFPCSNYSSAGMLTCSGCENMGVVLIKAYPTGASITYHPGESDTHTSTSMLSLGDDPGTHTFTVSLSGYSDYTGQYQICTDKMTYVTVQLSAVTTPTPTLIYVKPGLLTTIKQVSIATTTPTATATTTASATTATVTTGVAVTTGTTASVETATTAETVATRTRVATTASTTASSGSTGALNVSTTPSGAAVYVDGVQRGIAPATIPGLLPGDHTLLLKLDGYSDLSVPVTITAGQTQAFTTSLSPATRGTTAAATTKSPGFAAAVALVALAGAAIVIGKIR